MSAMNNRRQPRYAFHGREVPAWWLSGYVVRLGLGLGNTQESCGSCWAFSMTGVIHAAHFIATGIRPVADLA